VAFADDPGVIKSLARQLLTQSCCGSGPRSTSAYGRQLAVVEPGRPPAFGPLAAGPFIRSALKPMTLSLSV
jgi:hypothetical protein